MIILSESFKSHVQAQLSANLIKSDQRKGKDIATVLDAFSKEFDISWKNLDYRLRTVPGKQFLSKLNEFLQEHFKISITLTQIINNIHKKQLDLDIFNFFESLNEFRLEKRINTSDKVVIHYD